MHEVLVNRLGGLSLPRKNVVGLTDRPDMTLDVYRGRKTTIQSTLMWSSRLRDVSVLSRSDPGLFFGWVLLQIAFCPQSS